MLSIIIVTDRDERRLVTTLAALVAGAAAGVVREVLLVEPLQAGQKQDPNVARVADVAGCNLIAVEGDAIKARDAGVAAARSQWLLILRPGSIPENGWTEEIAQFLERDFGDDAGVAAFRNARDPYSRATVAKGAKAVARLAFGPFADQGLLITRQRFLDVTGEASGPVNTPRLLSKIGRRNIRTLRTRLYVA